jgi:hypothetical protein
MNAPAPEEVAAPVLDERVIQRALRWLWTVATLNVLAFGAGAAWDRWWHTVHPFEDFWSPPHLFIYAVHALTIVAFARIVASAALRSPFAFPLSIPLAPFRVPGGLVLLGGGLLVISASGLFDMIWHTRFGLNETNWSFPHAMSGWGAWLTVLGFVAARFSLPRPVPWYVRLLLWVVLLNTTLVVATGALGHHPTLEHVRRVASLGPLAVDAAAQHRFRIYETWHLARTNPLFGPVSAVGVGAGIAILLGLEQRRSLLALVLVAATLRSISEGRRAAAFFDLTQDARMWFPLPYLPAGLLPIALIGSRVHPLLVWCLAGAVYGLITARLFGHPPITVPLAVVAMATGASLGMWIRQVVLRPSSRGVIGVLVAFGLMLPAALGLVDLGLRANTP